MQSAVLRKSYKYYLESLHDRASFYESTFVQGEKKGRKEGRKEGMKEALKKMIASGISEDEAVRILGGL